MKKVVPIFLLLACCDQAERPLDAKERQRMDSLSVAQIREVGRQIDSSCQQAHMVELPRLVDSILLERRREIQESLKNVPR